MNDQLERGADIIENAAEFNAMGSMIKNYTTNYNCMSQEKP